MKFGETFTEYLHGEQERFLNKCSHVEYKRLKKVLKSCRVCRALENQSSSEHAEGDESNELSEFCQCNSCQCMNLHFYQNCHLFRIPIFLCLSLYQNHTDLVRKKLQHNISVKSHNYREICPRDSQNNL